VESPSPAKFGHVIGFDDFPFQHEWRGNVGVVGAVFAGERMEGMVSGKIRWDGANATATIVRLVQQCKWSPLLRLVFLQGVAFGGFNVADVPRIHRTLQIPVLVVARYTPNREAVKNALVTHVKGGARKWQLIEKLGPMEPCANVYVQRAGLTLTEAQTAIERYALHGRIPEPLRVAHLVAGSIATGQSRGRT
jgi:hypothetical protein